MRRTFTFTMHPENRRLLSLVAAAENTKPSFWIEKQAREAAQRLLNNEKGAATGEFGDTTVATPDTNASRTQTPASAHNDSITDRR